mgnify:CR=1 FL=1
MVITETTEITVITVDINDISMISIMRDCFVFPMQLDCIESPFYVSVGIGWHGQACLSVPTFIHGKERTSGFEY